MFIPPLPGSSARPAPPRENKENEASEAAAGGGDSLSVGGGGDGEGGGGGAAAPVQCMPYELTLESVMPKFRHDAERDSMPEPLVQVGTKRCPSRLLPKVSEYDEEKPLPQVKEHV